MAIDIFGSSGGIVIGATGAEEILQNVRMILTTPKGSLPLDRNFGIDNTFLDQPMPLAVAQAIPGIFDAIEKYEPRVKVLEVSFENNPAVDLADGKLIPRVRLEIL